MSMTKVLFVSPEAAPFAKTGGLADVTGSLPAALLDKGVDARVILPLYGVIPQKFKDSMTYKKYIYVNVGWRNQYCGIFEAQYKGVKFYFLDNEYYFKRQGLYGYDDEAERFAYFCKAVLEAIPHLDFIPDIIHCNDWESGMVPVFLKCIYRDNDMYKNMRTLFTIHNLKYQGVFPKQILGDILGLEEEYYTPEKLEFHNGVSFIKGGLTFSDYITTVSPTYSCEIQEPYSGEGLDGLIRSRRGSLAGILNGIDYSEYDPSKDPFIFVNYSDRDIDGRHENKKRLQEMLNLDVSSRIPVIGIITRLVCQKGLDLVEQVLDDIISLGAELIVLGTGEGKYESMFTDAAFRHKRRISANIKFDDVLAHRIYAGSDIFLMPSKFEPCGLGQIIALRYGSVPLVRETGGLKDTICPFNEYTMEGNGFSFADYNAHDMLYTIKRAVDFYSKEDIWSGIAKKAMACDYSWDASASRYAKIYDALKG